MNELYLKQILEADQQAEDRAQLQLSQLSKRAGQAARKAVRKLERRNLQARAVLGKGRAA